jgi:hypothetical protein
VRGPAAGILFALAVALAAAPPAAATIRIGGTQQLADDSPELWGMKFAAAVTEFTGLGALEPLERGAVELGFEAGSIPALTREERRIGFDGTKVEEIDRGPAYGRIRGRIGLPAGFELGLGLVPPVELDGLEPLLLSASLSRLLRPGPRFRLGAELAAHGGRFEGDITCHHDAAAAGDDVELNPLGCEEPSDDHVEIRTASLALVGSLVPGRPGGFSPYLRLAAQYLDGRFEVGARYDGLVDETVLAGDDLLGAVAIGGAWEPAPAWRLAGEAAYTPLELRRAGETEDQSVFNFRLQVAWRLP